jgi:HTH-type transcriptional regulator, transcriptional repressor of NAD biosynthesis genes
VTVIRTALTLGKYAPLHHGHDLVIRTAMAETDRVIVMIYDCPETTSIPLAMRANWLADLYPGIEIVEARDGPRDVGETPEIKRRHEEYILRRLQGRQVTHFYSSEFYGEHVSAALNANDRRVDPERRQIPISSTQIRENRFQHRRFVPARVYRDLIVNVALLGAPARGKTTLSEALARGYGTQWMPEYGREHWERHQVDRRLTPAQLVEVAERHLEREEHLLLDSNRYLFCDTNALTTLLFARYYHGTPLPRLQDLANRAASRYQVTFVCDDDIP